MSRSTDTSDDTSDDTGEEDREGERTDRDSSDRDSSDRDSSDRSDDSPEDTSDHASRTDRDGDDDGDRDGDGSLEDGVDPIERATADVDTALGRLVDVVGRLGDGDLHRAHRDGGWSVAQVISHVNVCALLWCGDIARLLADPDLAFFYREEVGHDALGYPPPTVDLALGQLASTRRTLAAVLPDVPDAILERTIEIPDLGTMTVGEWTPPIIGHLTQHVDQAVEILRDRDAMPAED